MIIFLPIYLSNNYFNETLKNDINLLLIWTVFSMSVFQVYQFFMHGKFGQTLGKKAMGIKIVTYPEEAAIIYKHSFIRDLPYTVLLIIQLAISIAIILSPSLTYNSSIASAIDYLSYANLVWFLLEIITMLFNDKRRALHDIIAKTVVIKM